MRVVGSGRVDEVSCGSWHGSGWRPWNVKPEPGTGRCEVYSGRDCSGTLTNVPYGSCPYGKIESFKCWDS